MGVFEHPFFLRRLEDSKGAEKVRRTTYRFKGYN